MFLLLNTLCNYNIILYFIKIRGLSMKLIGSGDYVQLKCTKYFSGHATKRLSWRTLVVNPILFERVGKEAEVLGLASDQTDAAFQVLRGVPNKNVCLISCIVKPIKAISLKYIALYLQNINIGHISSNFPTIIELLATTLLIFRAKELLTFST